MKSFEEKGEALLMQTNISTNLVNPFIKLAKKLEKRGFFCSC